MSPLLILSGILYSKIVSRMSFKEQETYSQAGHLAEQVFSGIKTVFAYNGCEYELNLYKNLLKRSRKNGVVMGLIFGLVNGLDYLIVFCADALGFWFATKLIRSNSYSIGQSLTVFFSVINAMFALSKAAPFFQSIVQAKGYAQPIWEIMQRQNKKKKSLPSKTLNIEGNIRFVNVSFCYPSRPNLTILKDISFDISSGQTVAIVGTTGSGKSTCFELLERFYEPKNGFIYLDGKHLNEYDVHSLRQSIGIVNQQTVLFETTVMENIRMGCEQVTNQQIIQLCQQIGINQMICNLSKV